MRVIVESSPEQVARVTATFVAALVRKKPTCVLGLATGSTPLGLYRELIRLHREEGLDFSRVTSFNLDEYVGLAPSHPQSYRYFMQHNFFQHINIDQRNTHVPDGRALDFEAHAEQYERRIKDEGGIDLQVLGIGSDGHIAFNEPGDFLVAESHPEVISERTIDANARWFQNRDEVPRLALTMGMKSILAAKQILMLATGAEKREMQLREDSRSRQTATCENELASPLQGLGTGVLSAKSERKIRLD